MVEFFRSIRLGGISIFGVALPGVLLLGFALIGLILPIVTIATSLTGGNLSIIAYVAQNNQVAGAVAISLVGYTLGYILRLYSPDDLDRISGDIVRRRMEPDERKVWPYTGQKGDKFPYFNTRQYFEKRAANEEAALVTWGPDGVEIQHNESQAPGKRSKTVFNRYKLLLAMSREDFAAIAESHEAHIRLMFGAWLSMRWAAPLVIAGAIASYLYVSCADSEWVVSRVGHIDASVIHRGRVWCSNLLSIDLVLLFCMVSLMQAIAKVFHYRRVGELVYVLQAWSICNDMQNRTQDGGPSDIKAHAPGATANISKARHERTPNQGLLRTGDPRTAHRSAEP